MGTRSGQASANGTTTKALPHPAGDRPTAGGVADRDRGCVGVRLEDEFDDSSTIPVRPEEADEEAI